jgi:hypothetical protein
MTSVVISLLINPYYNQTMYDSHIHSIVVVLVISYKNRPYEVLLYHIYL